MKKDKGRKILLILLICGLLSLIIAYQIQKTDHKKKIEETDMASLSNPSLTLNRTDSDTILIEGQGVLESHDLELLYDKKNISRSDIRNIIIGNTIEEIGYDVFNGYDNLETLRIGDGVTKIRNGSVKKCKKLRFMYLPSGIEMLSQDFLYEVPLCFIVTDGTYNNADFGNQSVFVNKIETYEQLEKALANRQFKKEFLPSDLSLTDNESTYDEIVVEPGQIQYGPYIYLKAGTYDVEISGDNFAILEEQEIYNYPEEIDTHDISIRNDTITYSFTLKQDTDNVEMCIGSEKSNEENIVIYKVALFYNEIPDVIRRWWIQ